MPTLRVEHGVRDWDAWKQGFDNDPVGREQAVYEECATAIWKHLDAFTTEILALASSRPANA